MTDPLKIVFAGTPEFSVLPLEALINSEHQVIAVYTQPDRPAGRGRKLKPSPVKEVALRHDIPVFQPKNFRDSSDVEQLDQLQADLMVVVAYGLLLPASVLNAPRLGCVNIHASLLPRWRGAAPIQRAILAGDQETGITIMQMDEGLDTGPMLHVLACPITPDDTGGSLHDKLAPLGAKALMEALPGIADGSIQPVPQENEGAVYATKLDKAEATLEWERAAAELIRQIRAFNPWPVAQTRYNDVVVRIWDATLMETCTGTSGQVVQANKDGILVAAGSGGVNITRLQMPGKKPVSAADFLNGHSVEGESFG